MNDATAHNIEQENLKKVFEATKEYLMGIMSSPRFDMNLIIGGNRYDLSAVQWEFPNTKFMSQRKSFEVGELKDISTSRGGGLTRVSFVGNPTVIIEIIRR